MLFTDTPALDRRGFLKLASLSWLTPVGQLLAVEAEPSRQPAQSIILLWLGGGPSQLETFDPHSDTKIAGGTKAIATAVQGIQLAQGFEQLADQMGSIALIRSMVSKEGDHERGTYLMKTGYRPDPTVEHPTIGAISCHKLPVGQDRHSAAYLDPDRSVASPEEASWGASSTRSRRVTRKGPASGCVLRSAGPAQTWPASATSRSWSEPSPAAAAPASMAHSTARHSPAPRVMMSSEQLKAFDVSHEPASVRAEYGDTPFGRGCLAARRLTEVGVSCVEVTLDGWDTHVNNDAFQSAKVKILDPAFAALLHNLRRRNALDRTVVLCCGEFGGRQRST